MSQLKTNSYYKNLTANELYTGTPQIINEEYNTLKISIQTDEQGTLTVYHSIDGLSWSHYGDVFAIASDNHKQVTLKGKYVYVSYLNGADATTNFNLVSYLSKAIHNNIDVKLTTEDTVSITPVGGAMDVNVVNSVVIDGMTFTDGALVVTGGGGGGGDASASNQDLQITEAISTNTKLDTINTTLTGSLAVTGDFYQTTQPVSIADSVAVTGDFYQTTQPVSIDTLPSIEINNFPALQETNDAGAIAILENIYEATGDTAVNTTPIAYSPVHLDLETQGATAWADSTLAWTAPLNGENGWQYQNTTAGGANLYFYGNTALVAGGIEPDITLGSLMNMSFVGNYRLLLDSNPNKKFYLALTTKATGSGDAYPGVFHSRKVWQLPSSTVVSKGADYLFYAMDDITSFRRDLDHKQMTLAITNGDCGPEEVVQFMSINVDSATPANEFSGIVKEAYFSNAGGTNRQVIFDNSIARKAELNISELTVGMGTLQVNMGGFTFNGDDELLVTKQTYVDIRSSGIDLTHTTNGAKECLDVSVDNIVKCDTDAVVVASGSITVSGDVGLVAGTQVNLLDSTVGLVENTTVGLSAGSQVELINSSVGLTAGAQVEVINSTVGLTEGSIVGLAEGSMVGFIADSVVGIAGDSVIGITGSVQTHNFASSNGTDWHHLASDANGRIITLSRTHDGSGNDITSTAVSGTETYRALDVVCKGAVSVQNVSSTQLAIKAQQYGYYGNLLNNVATILPAGVSSGLDVSAWSYFIGAYEDYYAGMPGTGSLRLQYSFDNTTYYDLFGTTISPGGVGTPRSANIQKQDIPGINWIRFKNDSSVTLASVTITLLGASI